MSLLLYLTEYVSSFSLFYFCAALFLFSFNFSSICFIGFYHYLSLYLFIGLIYCYSTTFLQVLKGAESLIGRPGASLEPLDFGALKDELEETHGITAKEVDIMSAALYPKVCRGETDWLVLGDCVLNFFSLRYRERERGFSFSYSNENMLVKRGRGELVS